MNFLAVADYEMKDGRLHVRAEHDRRHYIVTIPRQVFEAQYGATPTGDFHEYWGKVVDHREELESIALGKLAAAPSERAGVIEIANDDFARPQT